MMTMMRSRVIAAAAILAVVAGLAVLYVMMPAPVHDAAHPPQPLAKLAVAQSPKSIPDVAFSDASAKRLGLADFKGRYVLLNLWATWCGPCVKELPALARLSRAVPADKLTVVAVNVGRSDAAETKAFLAKHKADALNVYVDGNVALMRAFTAYGLPVSVLIDPQGREIARATGAAEWDAPEAVEYFKALSEKKPAS